MTETEERVGRAAHEWWKTWIVESGYADHPLTGYVIGGDENHTAYYCTTCKKQDYTGFHHPDMLPWEGLSDAKRKKHVGMGMAGYVVCLAMLAEAKND